MHADVDLRHIGGEDTGLEVNKSRRRNDDVVNVSDTVTHER